MTTIFSRGHGEHFSPQSTQTPDTASLPSLLNSSTRPKPCAMPQGGLEFGRTEPSHRFLSPRPSLKSAMSTRRSICLQRRNSVDTDFKGLVPTVLASEMTNTIEVGPLTSQLFDHKSEVNTNPLDVSGFRQQAVASGGKRWQAAPMIFNSGESLAKTQRYGVRRNLCEVLSHFQMSKNRCDKVNEIENSRMCNFLKCLDKRSLHEYLEKKAERAFEGEFAAQKRCFEVQAGMDGGEWQRQNAEIPLYETSRQLQSQKMELSQAPPWIEQAQREKSWLFGELDTRNRAFQEDRGTYCQEIGELRRICCMESGGARQLKIDEFSVQQNTIPPP